jgi:glycosyltransferase involved in cell wall biosynthesis
VLQMEDTKARLPLIVVAGQIPPPIGGQNIVIQTLITELSGSTEWRTAHLEFRFTPSWTSVRRVRLYKVTELIRVLIRFLRLVGRHGKADLLLYPSGGPQTLPLIRDLLLIPLLRIGSRRFVIQFHAAGIADRMERSNFLLRRAVRLVHKGIAGAIVMTDFNRRDPVALGIETVNVIPYRIPDDNSAACLPDLSAGITRLLYVGHLCEDKGTPQLLEAFGAVAGHFRSARLVLVGEFLAPYSEKTCRSRIAELGLQDRVELTGLLTGARKREQFRGATCFVFPSIAPYESFGLVLVEAMMWGLPLLVSDWRGNMDVVGLNPGGVTVPVTADFISSIKDGLTTLLNSRDDWPAWALRNRQRFKQNFSGGMEDMIAFLHSALSDTSATKRPM